MKHIETMKLALEGAANYIDALGGDSRKYRQALAEQPAIKQDLTPEQSAQPQQEPVLVVEVEPDYMSGGHHHKGSKPYISLKKLWSIPIGTKLYTSPPAQQQEPVAFVKGWNCGRLEVIVRSLNQKFEIDQPLYTSPPAQPSKPLTLGQKQRLWSSVGYKPTLKDRVNAYGTAIEAAHGIKENT